MRCGRRGSVWVVVFVLCTSRRARAQDVDSPDGTQPPSPAVAPAPAPAPEPPPPPAPFLPIAFVARPLSLPRGVLQSSASFAYVHSKSDSVSVDSTGAAVGAALGVSSDVTLRFAPALMTFSPKAEYTGFSFGVLARFVRTWVEIGAAADVEAVTTGDGGATVVASLPLLFHAGSVARIDVAPQLRLFESRISSQGAALPVALTLQPFERVYVGVAGSAGFVAETNRHPGAQSVGASGYVGLSIGGNDHPLVDVRPHGDWTTTWIGNGGATIVSEIAGADLVGYFDL